MSIKFKNILIPVTGNLEGEHSFRIACNLARTSKSELHVIYVIEVSLDLPVDADMDLSKGESILKHIEEIGKEEKCKLKAHILQSRHAGPAIIQEAFSVQADLIVLGPSLNNKHDDLISTTPSYILANAQCPVILWMENEHQV